jgi:hypothetical protein
MSRSLAKRPPELLLGLLLLGSIPLLGLFRGALEGSRRAICLFRVMTGRPCVFCGMTRALAEAAHGSWGRATRFHPLWALAAAAILLFGITAVVDGLTGSNRLARLTPSGRVVAAGFLLVVLLTILRALFGPVPEG